MQDVYILITKGNFNAKKEDIETLNSEDTIDVCEIDREFASVRNIENMRIK